MSTDPYVRAADLDELRDAERLVVAVDGQTVLLFLHDGEVHALDNRCPHMGFPLKEGTIEDGILTCHWHHARFEITCGDTFDPWADDVTAFPVEVREGSIYVDPSPPEEPPAQRWQRRLRDGLEDNLSLVIAKSVVGLMEAGVDPEVPVDVGLEFGLRYRSGGWSTGLTILTCMANLLPYLERKDQMRALYQGLVHVARDAAGQSPRFPRKPLETDAVGPERLKNWFRGCIDVRDANGAESALQTAIAHPSDDATRVAVDALAGAVTDHLFVSTGHTLDFINKACESLDHVGWERAGAVLPSLVPGLADATWSEEQQQWRQPVDLADKLFALHDRLPELVERGRQTRRENGAAWTPPASFADQLLNDDPDAILAQLADAIAEGATCRQLAGELAHAALLRIARFPTSNDFNDWDTVHHTFTYLNAVHQLAARTDAPQLFRAVLDGAMRVYLDRFLNVPPARLPTPKVAGEPEAIEEAAVNDLQEAFERQGGVDRAGEATARFLAAGGDPRQLIGTFGHALLREDVGFHTIQNLEACVRQCEAADSEDRRHVALVAAARYLAAHLPTDRTMEQTFQNAYRLHRGEKLHEG